MAGDANPEERWPELALDRWRDTRDTLHMWTQVVGKVRLALAPPRSHWWHVPLYVDSRGLTTSAIPYGDRTLEIRFDFLEHGLRVDMSDGRSRELALVPRSVRSFHEELFRILHALDVHVHIWTMPVEVADPIPFEEDELHRAYDPDAAQRFWRVLTRVDALLQEFAGRFVGKQSPIHFFWGSFDLAQTRFSGRRAPARPDADRVTREAYSHEVVSVGFWPGGVTPTGVAVDETVFYAYAAPEPPGFREAPVQPIAARYDGRLSEFLLPYDEVRASSNPREALLAFAQSVYEAAATLGGWDRDALERHEPVGREAPQAGAPA